MIEDAFGWERTSSPDQAHPQLVRSCVKKAEFDPGPSRFRARSESVTFLPRPDAKVDHNVNAERKRSLGEIPLNGFNSGALRLVKQVYPEGDDPLVRGQTQRWPFPLKLLASVVLPAPGRPQRRKRVGIGRSATPPSSLPIRTSNLEPPIVVEVVGRGWTVSQADRCPLINICKLLYINYLTVTL